MGSSDDDSETQHVISSSRTKTLKKTTSSPSWEDKIGLYVTDPRNEKIYISICNSRIIGSADILCESTYYLEDISETLSKEVLLPLHRR